MCTPCCYDARNRSINEEKFSQKISFIITKHEKMLVSKSKNKIKLKIMFSDEKELSIIKSRLFIRKY